MAALFDPANYGMLDKAALLSELGLMRRVFESVVNGVSISDATAPDLPLIYVNPAFEKMTGYSSEDVLGRNCRFLQRGETSHAELATLRNAIRRGEDVRVVLKNYTKQGATFWNELYLSPVFDSANRLTHYVGIQNDITGRVELKRRMEYMALHDSLTDLANRSLAMDRLQQSLERARRHGTMTGVFFVDLDGFKAINDRYGHESGDELLRAVAARLRLAIRASDCAARVGGDEFVLIASDLSCEMEAEEMKARVLSRIEEPLILDTARITPRASVGVSMYPRNGDSPQELLRAADLSMYLQKRTRSENGADRGPLENSLE
jgi:diguanylate cyclase (GGDEF)-like protein/PAS domain S-box-containing protein